LENRILSEIWIYPIKSLGGIKVNAATVKDKGLEGDRRWMLVDPNWKFITQRDVHQLSLFKLSFGNEVFEVRFRDDKMEIPFTLNSRSGMKATIWNDEVEVIEADRKMSEWFSGHLGQDCKLVFFPESNSRRIDPSYVPENKDVGLADAYPFLIIGQRSLDDLNSRLEQSVPINRFRPNFVFTGGEPYEEDLWRKIKIGENQFEGVKPCDRCILTTIDQETATKGREPLLTLSKYRKDGDKILFGQNLVALKQSTIRVGEKIVIESIK
jgi:hypothetical protein